MTEQYRALAVAIFSMATTLPGFSGIHFSERDGGITFRFAFEFDDHDLVHGVTYMVSDYDVKCFCLDKTNLPAYVVDQVGCQLLWRVPEDRHDLLSQIRGALP